MTYFLSCYFLYWAMFCVTSSTPRKLLSLSELQSTINTYLSHSIQNPHDLSFLIPNLQQFDYMDGCRWMAVATCLPSTVVVLAKISHSVRYSTRPFLSNVISNGVHLIMLQVHSFKNTAESVTLVPILFNTFFVPSGIPFRNIINQFPYSKLSSFICFHHPVTCLRALKQYIFFLEYHVLYFFSKFHSSFDNIFYI